MAKTRWKFTNEAIEFSRKLKALEISREERKDLVRRAFGCCEPTEMYRIAARSTSERGEAAYKDIKLRVGIMQSETIQDMQRRNYDYAI